MVVERFLQGTAPVYQRFAERGRLLPEGLRYLDSWVDQNGGRCFQLMETDAPELFEEWTRLWADLVSFEIVPVIPSTEATTRLDPRPDR